MWGPHVLHCEVPPLCVFPRIAPTSVAENTTPPQIRKSVFNPLHKMNQHNFRIYIFSLFSSFWSCGLWFLRSFLKLLTNVDQKFHWKSPSASIQLKNPCSLHWKWRITMFVAILPWHIFWSGPSLQLICRAGQKLPQ